MDINLNMPNLDAMTNEELSEFVGVLERLTDIARAMERARMKRIHGDINGAMAEERYVDHAFRRLPKGARW